MKKILKNKKIIRPILFALVGLIIGLSLYNFNAKKITRNQMPMPLGFGLSVVLSGSMEPTLSVNDLVFVVKTDKIEINDIIVFQDGNSLVIHRVIGIDGDVVKTQGDANNAPDDDINISDVKGKMVFAIPFAGGLLQVISQPIVVLLIVVLIILLTEFSYRKEKENDNDELAKIQEEINELNANLKNKE